MTVTKFRPASGTDGSVSALVASDEATEDSVALQFVELYAGRLLYVNTLGKWYWWDGSLWQIDQRQRAFHFARMACRSFGDRKLALSKANSAAGVERFAKADPRLSMTADQFDHDPMLLGTPDGTLDLTTGELRAADPHDRISKATSVVPASGPPVRWLKFLHDATDGQAEVVKYLQRWCGYALTGITREHQMAFVYGPGGNGKSVFMNILVRVTGDYAITSPMETFTSSRFDRHTTDLAMLRGARLVCASETDEGRAWAEARIKQLTGGDQITARFMRQDNFTFVPEFKLFITGNYAPRLHNVDEAMRRRLAIIPFLHKPPVPDRELEAKLLAELPQILNWMIAGCLAWQREGLDRPEAVAEATARYFDEQDSFGQWLDECCDLGPELYESAGSLFSSWSRFAKAAGDNPGTQRSLASVLVKRGFEPVKMSGGTRSYRGLSIKPSNQGGGYDARF